MGSVQCLLCPFKCILKPNQRGVCQVRVNLNGKLISLVYGKAASINIDPIEKKPIFHMYPGSDIFSIATFGCNLGCRFCQNWQLSQQKPDGQKHYSLPPETVVNTSQIYKCRSIAYTYSEPIVFYEYVYDSASIAKERNIKNVMVTAGFINKKPLKKLNTVIDAANVDLKGFSDKFYREYCSGALKPVLNTLVTMKEDGLLVEITNLIIPTINDDLKLISKMCKWIASNLGKHTPLHLSRFHPMYKLKNLPPTPKKTLINARKTALDNGLKYVYIGNISTEDGETTFCPSCKKPMIKRIGYTILVNNVVKGMCPDCNTKIEGIW